jgi:threonine/homoserine/homoserine lactone efflux protein
MDPLLIAYVSFTAVLVLTPGSTTAVVVRNALAGGRSAGLAAALGAAVGNTSHATAAGLGLAVVFARWPVALLLLRIAGAAYLAWLGAASLHRVIKYPDGGLRMMNPVEAASQSRRGHITEPRRDHTSSFRQGLAVNLLNPAIATFYLVVLPSFMPAGAPPRYFAALAVIHVAMAFACHSVWAVALDTVRRAFHPPVVRRLLEGATAVALVALSIRVLLG